ncbi:MULTISPECIES: HTH domain-containing protein [unclassified Microcoleus]|uniref:HTH domain-containing protein n=1 Tax=unclassified Microcoleus TaxID=2642155 RepID=UPI002FD3D683
MSTISDPSLVSQPSILTSFLDRGTNTLHNELALKLAQLKQPIASQILNCILEADAPILANEIEEKLQISRSTALKYANQLAEIGLIGRNIKVGSENNIRPTYQFFLPDSLTPEESGEIIIQIGQGNVLKKSFQHQSTSCKVEQTFDNVSSDEAPQESKSFKEIEDQSTQEVNDSFPATYQDNQDPPNTTSFVTSEPLTNNSPAKQVVTLKEVWDTLIGLIEIYNDRLDKQEVRIEELERQLSLTQSVPTTKLSREELLNLARAPKQKSSLGSIENGNGTVNS